MEELLVNLLDKYKDTLKVSPSLQKSVFVRTHSLKSLLTDPQQTLRDLFLTPRVGETNRNNLKGIVFAELNFLFPKEWALSGDDRLKDTSQQTRHDFDRVLAEKLNEFRRVWDHGFAPRLASQTIPTKFFTQPDAYINALISTSDPVVYVPRSVPDMIKTKAVLLSEGDEGSGDFNHITNLLSALSQEKIFADGSVILLDMMRMEELASMKGIYASLCEEEALAQLKILKNSLGRMESSKAIVTDLRKFDLMPGFTTENGPLRYCGLGGHLEIHSLDLSRSFISISNHAAKDGVMLDDWLSHITWSI